jgi:hypothetical protein
MKGAVSSDMLANIYQTIQRHIPEDSNFRGLSYCQESLKHILSDILLECQNRICRCLLTLLILVYIATSFQQYNPSSIPSKDKSHLIFTTSSSPALGPTQPPMQWVSWALFPGVKRPGREADHSSPTNSVVKKLWIYTSTPSYAFMA